MAPPDGDDLDARIGAALARISLAARHLLQRSASTVQLSPMQALILERLARQGPAGVGDLAATLAVRPPTVSDSLDALERRGLLRRTTDDEDARRVVVRLTVRGRRLAAELALWPDLLAGAVSRLSRADREALLRVLLTIVAELVARGVVYEARMCTTCDYFRPFAHRGWPAPHHCALLDAPLADAALRLDCPDHRPLDRDGLVRRLPVLQQGAP
ncbi:MAG: MarR family winged helix-turn-helix transcriptional regulator [Myxococcota bacterium]|nr:MarR family winged helix-turn-helix transcriptional regulator [Myxococcota bacterium]MDW8361567.1 MarR family winged helix-turn-helix transcriptional regulator [Myxococcales bacterium]